MNHRIPHLSLLLTAPALLLISCESKKDSSSDADSADQPAVITLSGANSSNTSSGSGFAAQYSELLDTVNAQCPQDYPEVVTPLPEAHELAKMNANDLMAMLDSWNPVLRMEAAKELGNRGGESIVELRKGTHSENDKIRAGSATALAAICKNIPKDQIPDDLVDDFIRLTTDEEHEVRVAALKALGTLAPKTKEATLAVLAMCTDPNEYLAQDAKVTLNKYFEAHTLPIEDIEAGLKAAMGGPLPNGKGHIVQIINRLKPMDQRRFIPELLAHLDWYAPRDTMFAGGGQEMALKMLTKLEVTELVPRLPKLMGKSGRGMHLYKASLESARAFGHDAKVLVPELKVILKDMEKNGKDAKITPSSRDDFKTGMDDLKAAIIEIDSL